MRMIPGTIALTLTLTLAFSAAAQAKPPRCNEQGEGKAVSIEVIVQEKRVEPKECTVTPDTKVTWYLGKNQPFEADFGDASPDPANGPKFKSSRVFFHHEAKMTARDVKAKTAYTYTLTVEGEAYDPAIIIDP